MTRSTRSEPSTGHSNHGVVASVRGSVVDVCFEDRLPAIYTLLRAGSDAEIAIEVLMQLDVHHVRGIALSPTQGLARGMAVEDTGGPLKVPVGKEILSRMFDVFGNPIDRQPAPSDVEWRTIHRDPPPLSSRSTKSEVFETGIWRHRRASAAGNAAARPDYSGARASASIGAAHRDDSQHGRAPKVGVSMFCGIGERLSRG